MEPRASEFPGATGTGHPTTRPLQAGQLFANIPVDLSTLVAFWDTVLASRKDPLSAWHWIDEFKDFSICMRAQRQKTGFFSRSPWFCEFGCYLGKMEMEVRGLI